MSTTSSARTRTCMVSYARSAPRSSAPEIRRRPGDHPHRTWRVENAAEAHRSGSRHRERTGLCKGRGIVVNEPSVVALANRDNTVVAVGREAQQMMGRVPQSISVIRPMRDGVIADYLITEAMLRYFINRVVGRFNLIKPEVMVCIPAGVDQRRTACRAGRRRAGGRAASRAPGAGATRGGDRRAHSGRNRRAATWSSTSAADGLRRP